MASAYGGGSVLDTENLRQIDEWLLDYLSEGRVTPHYCRTRMIAEEDEEYTRGYVQERLAELASDNYAENLRETGLYELREDPRDSSS